MLSSRDSILSVGEAFLAVVRCPAQQHFLWHLQVVKWNGIHHRAEIHYEKVETHIVNLYFHIRFELTGWRKLRSVLANCRGTGRRYYYHALIASCRIIISEKSVKFIPYCESCLRARLDEQCISDFSLQLFAHLQNLIEIWNICAVSLQIAFFAHLQLCFKSLTIDAASPAPICSPRWRHVSRSLLEELRVLRRPSIISNPYPWFPSFSISFLIFEWALRWDLNAVVVTEIPRGTVNCKFTFILILPIWNMERYRKDEVLHWR